MDSSLTAITVEASTGARWIAAPATLAAVPYLKIRTGTAGAPVAQAAAPTIDLVVK